jgi:hypothetical protein
VQVDTNVENSRRMVKSATSANVEITSPGAVNKQYIKSMTLKIVPPLNPLQKVISLSRASFQLNLKQPLRFNKRLKLILSIATPLRDTGLSHLMQATRHSLQNRHRGPSERVTQETLQQVKPSPTNQTNINQVVRLQWILHPRTWKMYFPYSV